MKVELFDFELPESSIATHPVEPRDASRLLQVNADGALKDYHFRDLPELLEPGDVMVFNNTRVLPARLFGQRGEVKVELLLHKPLPSGEWLAFAKPAKRLKVGQEILFAEGFSATVTAKQEDGQVMLAFACGGQPLHRLLEQHGHMPLPPYIRREDTLADRERYQTVYAKAEGSVAAPTAGLHFTPELLARLDTRGIQRLEVTLHVGAGTFQPVKVEDTDAHMMHSEWGYISPEVAKTITAAKKAGRRIVAVGTTSLRLLESAADTEGQLHAYEGETAIFITPGYRFKLVDVLVTNFHLPKSTLFMLVCAFRGRERMQTAYTYAIENKYRFYSYGDGCLLIN